MEEQKPLSKLVLPVPVFRVGSVLLDTSSVGIENWLSLYRLTITVSPFIIRQQNGRMIVRSDGHIAFCFCQDSEKAKKVVGNLQNLSLN